MSNTPARRSLSPVESLAAKALNGREKLPHTELSETLANCCQSAGVPVPTDLILATAEQWKTDLSRGEVVEVLKAFLRKAEERKSETPAVPVLHTERRKQKSRSQNHTPMRGYSRHLPLPSFPVSVSVFYQEGKANKVWSEAQERHCKVQSERSNLAEYNLVLRRFPELQRSLRASADFDRPRAVSPNKEPRYRAPTERRITQQRTLENSPGKAGYQALKTFIPANPSEARDSLDRIVHGFQGTPYEAKREEDYADFKRSKEVRVAKEFRPAYVGQHLADRSLYMNSQLSPMDFTQKTNSKRVTHSQTFYP